MSDDLFCRTTPSLTQVRDGSGYPKGSGQTSLKELPTYTQFRRWVFRLVLQGNWEQREFSDNLFQFEAHKIQYKFRILVGI